jgi:hypothetical protein
LDHLQDACLEKLNESGLSFTSVQPLPLASHVDRDQHEFEDKDALVAHLREGESGDLNGRPFTEWIVKRVKHRLRAMSRRQLDGKACRHLIFDSFSSGLKLFSRLTDEVLRTQR